MLFDMIKSSFPFSSDSSNNNHMNIIIILKSDLTYLNSSFNLLVLQSFNIGYSNYTFLKAIKGHPLILFYEHCTLYFTCY